MAFENDGSYRANRRVHKGTDGAGAGVKKAPHQKPEAAAMHKEHGSGEHAHKHVIHHPGGHENPSPGKYHSEVHHGDGNVDHQDHDTYDEAVEHGRPHMEQDENGGYGHGESEGEAMAEAGHMSDGAV